MNGEPAKGRARRSLLVFVAAMFAWAGCTDSYPKDKLHEAIRKLFKEELDVDCRSKLAGRTLYVSFPIRGLISEDFELSKDVTTNLENAMLSISRIALSTNAEIDYTVLQAVDGTWGVRTQLIRRMQDLKDLIYWRISKTDFDERLVLEIKKDRQDAKHMTEEGFRESPGEGEWNDIQLPEYMSRWVASRINLGTRANPFLGVFLGIEKVTPSLDLESKTLSLELDQFSDTSYSTAMPSVSLSLFRGTVEDQMSEVEKKYPIDEWVDRVVLKNRKREALMTISRDEWKNSRKEKKETVKN